jgi:hypothetical protein
MNQSNEIEKITQALIKVQEKLEHVPKTTDNDYFSSKYSTLNDVWDEAKKHLKDNGLCIAQYGDVKDGIPILVTKLMHESGQWIEGGIKLVYGTDKGGVDNPQKIASAVTYMRRYGLSAMLGICSEVDDDGNKAAKNTTPSATTSPAPQTASQPPQGGQSEYISDKQSKRLYAIRKQAGWDDAPFRQVLLKQFAVGDDRCIPWKKYNDICAFFEKAPAAVATMLDDPGPSDDDIPF